MHFSAESASKKDMVAKARISDKKRRQKATVVYVLPHGKTRNVGDLILNFTLGRLGVIFLFRVALSLCLYKALGYVQT